jgi:hypothetical protein
MTRKIDHLVGLRTEADHVPDHLDPDTQGILGHSGASDDLIRSDHSLDHLVSGLQGSTAHHEAQTTSYPSLREVLEDPHYQVDTRVPRLAELIESLEK